MRCLGLRSQETFLRSDILPEEIPVVKVVFSFLLVNAFPQRCIYVISDEQF